MVSLLAWHFFVAPMWIVALAWNLERAAARYFSAGILLRTLISHWHKDAVSYKQGTITGIAVAFAWNMISRVIGFVVRTITLAAYFFVAIVIVFLAIIALGVFLLWPFAAVLGLVTSIQLLGM